MKKKTKSYHSGWESFSPEAGTVDKMYCRVCGEEMDVQRNVMGPTGFAEAMSVAHGMSKGHLHDSFHCKYAQENWHSQARVLKQKIEKEPSKIISDLLKTEVNLILLNRKVTKKGNWEYF
jgi:hypothetical protein